MKYIVNPWNNFCRIFELPERYPTEFCFNGSHPVNFQLVDWFYPTSVPQAAVPKNIWEENVGPVKNEDIEINHDDLVLKLLPFLKNKSYIKSSKKYLFIADFGMSFIF